MVSVEIELDGVAAGGEAVGRNPDNDKVVFVADGIPGERVEVVIVEDHARWQRGELARIVQVSPQRVTPPCPYFGPPRPVTLAEGRQLNPTGAPRCAGCRWQHIDYEMQLTLKRGIVVDTLVNLAALEKTPERSRRAAEALVQEVIALGSPDESAPDGLLDLHFLTQMAFGLDEAGALSLPARDGSLLPVDFCPLQHAQLAALFDAFAVDPESDQNLAKIMTGVTLCVGATGPNLAADAEGMMMVDSLRGDVPEFTLDLPVNVLLRRAEAGRAEADATVELLVGDWSYPVMVAGRRLSSYPPVGGRFFVSPHAIGSEVVAAVLAQILELRPFDQVVELWAGIGALSVQLAPGVATLIATDPDELAVAGLQANLAGVDSADVHRGKPQQILRRLRRGDYRVDVAVLSPPENELDDDLWSLLDKLRVARVAVVTEESAGLARALEAARAARYSPTTIQPIDLQPHQDSVTLVARFDRRI